jgi:hypothetical protein
MVSSPPRFRLRALFGASTAVVLTCALAVMLESTPPTQVAWRVFTMGLILGVVVGYRRAGTFTVRGLTASLFMLGAGLLGVFLSLVAGVWQDWQRATESTDIAGIGAGGFVICLLSPPMAVIALLMLRAWAWSPYDAHPLPDVYGDVYS